MTNGEIIEYCELCDKQFLEAMEAKLTSDKYKKLNKAFLKLAQEQ